MTNPDALTDPRTGWLSAAGYWKYAGVNANADRGDFVGETVRINGGTTNIAERQRYLALAQGIPLRMAPVAKAA